MSDVLKEKILAEMVESEKEYQKNKVISPNHGYKRIKQRYSKYAKKIEQILRTVREGKKVEVSAFEDIPKFNLSVFRLLLYIEAKKQHILLKTKEKIDNDLFYLIVQINFSR